MNEYERSQFGYINQVVFGKDIQRIVCPTVNCKQILPHNFFKSDTTVISIVGSSGVGKSYYAVTLIDLLRRNRILHTIGIEGDIINENEDVKNHIDQLLRQRNAGTPLDATPPQLSNLTWVVQISIRSGRKAKYIYLSFFDNGGEGFRTVDDLLTSNSNILVADGLIFLFSPRELPDIFNNEIANYTQKFPSSGIATSSSNDYTTIFQTLNNVIEVFRLCNNKPDDQTTRLDKLREYFTGEPKINIPIALCISWYDVIERKFYNRIPSDTDATEMSAIIQNGNVKYNAIQSYSNEIKNLLYNRETGNIRLRNKIETSLKRYMYFTIQTIKETGDGSMNYAESKGCLLPVLWMFKQLKMID
jgi:ABC-type dipeptide/oligopeptide/nickel transport system ATPase component